MVDFSRVPKALSTQVLEKGNYMVRERKMGNMRVPLMLICKYISPSVPTAFMEHMGPTNVPRQMYIPRIPNSLQETPGCILVIARACRGVRSLQPRA